MERASLRRWAAALCLVSLLLPVAAGAADYPVKPIKLIVSAASGTAPDLVARLVGPKLSEKVGQPVIVENRPGANGSIAVEAVSRAAADGYTLLVTPAGTMTANPYLYPKTGTLALTGLSPVSRIGTVDFVVAVRSDLGPKTLVDLLALMRGKPGAINVATTARGSFPHLAAELLRQKADVKFEILMHNGGASAGAAVAGGHADVVIETASVLAPLAASGNLVMLASTGETRQKLLPDLPTVAEAGVPGYAMSGWIGFAAPKATPLELREAFRNALATVSADPAIAERLAAMHYNVTVETPEASNAIWRRQSLELGQLIRTLQITLE